MSQFNPLILKNLRVYMAKPQPGKPYTRERSEKWFNSWAFEMDKAMKDIAPNYKPIVSNQFIERFCSDIFYDEDFMKENNIYSETMSQIYENVQDKFKDFFDLFKYRNELKDITSKELLEDEKFIKFLNLMFSIDEYNPMKWDESYKLYSDFIELATSENLEKWELFDRLPSLKKIRANPPSEPIHEENEFKLYKIKDNTEANHIFWKKGKSGNYWCVLGNNYANNYGGYPFFVVTRKTEVRELPFACYLPSYLDKDTNQSVRNRHNTGPVEKEDFVKIKNLLAKADKRIKKYYDIFEK